MFRHNNAKEFFICLKCTLFTNTNLSILFTEKKNRVKSGVIFVIILRYEMDKLSIVIKFYMYEKI